MFRYALLARDTQLDHDRRTTKGCVDNNNVQVSFSRAQQVMYRSLCGSYFGSGNVTCVACDDVFRKDSREVEGKSSRGRSVQEHHAVSTTQGIAIVGGIGNAAVFRTIRSRGILNVQQSSTIPRRMRYRILSRNGATLTPGIP